MGFELVVFVESSGDTLLGGARHTLLSQCRRRIRQSFAEVYDGSIRRLMINTIWKRFYRDMINK